MRQTLSPVPTALLCSVALLMAGTAPVLAGAHGGAGGKPKTPPTPDAFYEHTGFEGREQVLTDAITKAVLAYWNGGAAFGNRLLPGLLLMVGAAWAAALLG